MIWTYIWGPNLWEKGQNEGNVPTTCKNCSLLKDLCLCFCAILDTSWDVGTDLMINPMTDHMTDLMNKPMIDAIMDPMTNPMFCIGTVMSPHHSDHISHGHKSFRVLYGWWKCFPTIYNFSNICPFWLKTFQVPDEILRFNWLFFKVWRSKVLIKVKQNLQTDEWNTWNTFEL